MALATFLAVVLIIVPSLLSEVSGSGDAEILRSTHAHSGSVVFTGLMQAVGFLLLAAPLVYLFRAVRARSDRVRSQLIGLVVAAPLFLALSTGLSTSARNEAADQFVAGQAKPGISVKQASEDCQSQLKDKGGKKFSEEFGGGSPPATVKRCTNEKVENEEASNAIGETSLASVVSGLGVAGGLGFVIALFYSCLWAMRTGLLSRFWASLGMALGVVTLLGLVFFTLIWFLYFGLLLLGRIPGGKPPAWPAGEAIPWPTPGEKAAESLEPTEFPEDPDPPALGSGNGDSPADGGTGSERRKRKQRDS